MAERYQIERELGSGGMATVYLARDLKHDREVALKVLREDLSAVIGTERFLAEVRITAKLDHPHILTLIDSGEAGGILYYVLPYVRGESLRAKLIREKQLGVDEALSIVKQVASALDYAHSHGVVHRDIKPENILLHEGEAVLADFGIALAVKEAGGNRLTETGLSLGTPQYMSPEQATGDRALDKRSDIYSLGAVYYEMITGEPPVTGATAQAMIAKLLTERPVKMRVVRPTISGAIERATEKALAKVPADRFTSAGDFARALAAVDVEECAGVRTGGNAKWIVGGAVAAAIIGVALYMAGHGSAEAPRARATLRDRVQLTNTGNVILATVSDDGKALAYAVTDCGTNGCRYAIELKDVGGSATRRVLEGATAIYRIEISPDRRNVVMLGSINAVYGSWMISLMGGAPRFVVSGMASFFAGGDSLIFTRVGGAAKKYWMFASGLDGTIADSVQIDGPGDRPPFPSSIPGSTRLVHTLLNDNVMQFVIVERDGRRVSSISAPGGVTGGMTASRDALWLYLSPPVEANFSLVRVPFDPQTMKLAPRGDTVYSGNTASMSLTADGETLIYDDGASDFSAWLLSPEDIVANRFTEDKRVVRATGSLRGAMSPDGRISVVGRDHPQGGREFSVIKTGVSGEIPIPGRHKSAVPLDSTTIKVSDITDSSTIMYLYDYRTRRRTAVREVRGAGWQDLTRAGNAWAWIPQAGTSVQVQRDDEARPRRFALPKWYKDIFWISGSRDGTKVAIIGYQAPNEDSMGVAVMSLVDGSATQKYATFGEGGAAHFADDGSLVVVINDTPESETLYHLKEGQPPRRIGSIPRLVSRTTQATISSDLRKVFVITRDDRRDVWMSKVVK